jgi:hypothetical protein
MRATFERLVLENPRLATAVLAVLELVAEADRRRAIRLIEAASTIVLASPRRTPERSKRSVKTVPARDPAS